MPDPLQLLEVSAGVEHAIRAAGGLALVALLVRTLMRAIRGEAPVRRALALTPRAERIAMAVILVWTLGSRLIGYASSQQPRWYFSQVSTLYIADALQAHDLGRRWLALLGHLQVISEHESPIQAPVAAAFQLVLGPSIELPTIIGAFWAVLAVVLAWRLGRAVEAPAFGVLFAATLALSPLQITWSRLGGIYIGASVGVLAALLAGWWVGRARGVPAAFALGIIAWSCVYYYYPARVGMGLAPVAMYAGWERSRRGRLRLGMLVAAALVGFVVCLLLQRTYMPGQSLWPAYTTYLGSSGEKSLWDWLANAVDVVRAQLDLVLRDYFWQSRMTALARATVTVLSRWPGSVLAEGMTTGGLVLLPMLLAGMVGLVHALRHPLQRGLWLALAVCGFLPPLLGYPSARRFLVFDVAWCAFAALGIVAVAESRLLDPATGNGRWRAAIILVGATAVWSAATVGLSAAALPGQHVYIPFGESGFRDGQTCLGCVDTARRWQREIERGHVVVALDTDMYRENPTSPGGIMTYGKTVALAVGHPDRFIDYYALVSNVDWGPPRPGQLTPAVPTDVALALATRFGGAAASPIVWWVTDPNAWERQLAEALVAAGSTRTTPATRPMWGPDRLTAPVAPIRIETPPERRGDALAALRALVDPPPPRSCVRLERVASRPYPKIPLLLAPMTDDDLPQWAAGGWREVEVWGREQPAHAPIGLHYASTADGLRSAQLLEASGYTAAWTASGELQARSPAPGPRPLGRYCAVLQEGRWWVIDPVAGTLWVPSAPSQAIPLGAIGIMTLGDDLGVATADQHVLVLNTRGGVLRRFPATVAPARRFNYGECAMLAAGRGWIASLDSLRGFLALYDGEGTPLGRVSLAQAVGAMPGNVNAIRGAGDYLGVAHDTTITTLRLVRDAACTTSSEEDERDGRHREASNERSPPSQASAWY